MISKGSDLLLNSLTQYYDKHPEHRKVLYEISKGTFPVSLRIMDWFITHYAKFNHITYWIDDEHQTFHETIQSVGPHLRKFHLYLEYRSQLKSFTKLYFDPFRRHERISFVLEHKPLNVMETTLGQLNFFRWIFQNHVLTYMLSHQTTIEKEMNEYHGNKKEVIPRPSRGQCKPISNMFFQSKCCLRFD